MSNGCELKDDERGKEKKISIVIIQRAHRDGNRESESERALNDVLCHLCLVYVRVRVYMDFVSSGLQITGQQCPSATVKMY